MSMPTGLDEDKQPYWDIEKVRITSVKLTFAGTPGLRIQSFQKNPTVRERMYIGVEIPISNKQVGLDFIASVIDAVQEVL